MKKILLVLGVTFFTAISAQDENQMIIMNDAKESAALMESKDPSIFIKQIHPAAFDFMVKETLINSFMTQTEGTADYKLNILPGSPEQITVSDIMEGKNGHYAIVNHPVNMEMTFYKKFDEKYKAALTESFAAQGITPQFVSDDTLRLTKNSVVIAINDEKTEGEWRYLTYQPDSEMLNAIVDADILRKAAAVSRASVNSDAGKTKTTTAEPKKKTAKKK